MEPLDQTRIFSDRYEVTHLIARGGMAQVFKAHDLLLDRVVALKVLFPELSVDRTFVERFRREAQAAAKLSHPNIVPVFDWGEDEGSYFIVMEFVDGEPLSATLREHGTLPPTRAAVIAANVASALSYAHRHGVVHRDVKPGNVLITADGTVKVTDFGIARAINTEESLTQAGSVMGTATYFSPEQAEGANVDARSDVYSLGIVLYEMLAGRPPFQGDSPVAVASKHVRDMPPLIRDFKPETPVAIEAIAMKAIAKQRSDRYPSADDMRLDLMRFAEGRTVEAQDPTIVLAGAMGATTMMDAVNTTQAVAVFPGPKTDLKSRRKTRNRKKGWTIAMVAVLVLAAAGLTAYGVTRKSPKTTLSVPNVIGMTQAKALSTLDMEGLQVGAVTTVASDKPINQVVATNPGVGLPISKGGKVDLSLSDGKGAVQVVVPNVTGQQLQAAENTLQTAGFTVKVVTTTSSSASPNTVLSQSPGPNSKVAKGSIITLTVVASPAYTTVPNLVGQSASVIGATLTSNNLQIGSQSTACDNTQPNGSVVSQSPAAGAQVSPSTSVSVVVSSGPCQVSVPLVTGIPLSQASQTLKAAGFNVAPDSSCSDPSLLVATQIPAAGNSATFGSTIQLTCNPAPSSTDAPTPDG